MTNEESIVERVHSYISKNDTYFSSESMGKMVEFFITDQAETITRLQLDNAKLHKNYIKACKGRMDFRNSFRELKIQNMLIREALTTISKANNDGVCIVENQYLTARCVATEALGETK